MESNRSQCYAIDLFRIICALLVINVHCGLFHEHKGILWFLFCKCIPRIAVPYFFAVSGYYYEGYEDRPLIRNIGKYLLPYTVWTIVYWSYDYYHGQFTYSWRGALYWFLVGSKLHLWFVPALIFNLILSRIIKNRRYLFYVSLFLYLLGVLIGSYGNILNFNGFMSIGVFQGEYFNYTVFRRVVFMAMPFFQLGRAIRKNWLHITIPVYIIFLIFIVEYYFIDTYKLGVDNITTIVLYPLIISIVCKLSGLKPCWNRQQQLERINKRISFRKISSFIYYSHLLIIGIVLLINPFSKSYFIWLITTFCCVVLGMLYSYIKLGLKGKMNNGSWTE